MTSSTHRHTIAALAVAAISTLWSSPAWADATAFIGATTTPSNRTTKGGAIGISLLIVGAEFEYAATDQDTGSGAPSIRIGTASGLLQTPFAIMGVQPYVITGLGFYRETLGQSSHSAFAPSVGGGAKISLAGPLRVRVDYRVFRLGSGAAYSPAHRIYAGLNLRF